MTDTEFLNIINKTRIIPVLKIEKSQETYSIIQAIKAGGINIAEITLRTKDALEAIRIAARNFNDTAIGAGTVINKRQAELAIKAGANFIVMPGFDKATVDYCRHKKIPVIPGCATPTEIMAAVNCGVKLIKLFPAENLGGTAYIDALKGPFSDCRFIATGGINLENAGVYLNHKSVAAVAASCLCTQTDIMQKNWPAVTENCRKAFELFSGVID